MKKLLSVKIQLMIEPNLVTQIDDWRFANRISSRSRAMRKLMVMGLDFDETKGPAEVAASPSHVTHQTA